MSQAQSALVTVWLRGRERAGASAPCSAACRAGWTRRCAGLRPRCRTRAAQRVVLLDAEAAHAAPRVLAIHGVEVFDREWAVAPAEIELLLGARPKSRRRLGSALRLGATLQVLRQPGVPLSVRKVIVVEAQWAWHKGLLGALPRVHGWKVACHNGAKGEAYWQVDVVQLKSLPHSSEVSDVHVFERCPRRAARTGAQPTPARPRACARSAVLPCSHHHGSLPDAAARVHDARAPPPRQCRPE